MKNNNKYDVTFKIVLFLVISVILYLFIKDEIDTSTKIFLLLVLYFLLLADYCNSIHNTYSKEGVKEGFIDADDDYAVDQSLTRREKRIQALNATRGMDGNFYVQCHKCGRGRLLEDRQQKELAKNLCPGCLSGVSKDGFCLGNCKQKEHQTMSFFNKQYIDTDQIDCYDCLLDRHAQLTIRNIMDFPPVNGPPQFDVRDLD